MHTRLPTRTRTCVTIPQSNACGPLMKEPVRMSCFARAGPISRGRFCVPPVPGKMPTWVSQRGG
jgi:hypothetical protein